VSGSEKLNDDKTAAFPEPLEGKVKKKNLTFDALLGGAEFKYY